MLPLFRSDINTLPGGVERRSVSLEIRKGFGPGSNVARDVSGNRDEFTRRNVVQKILLTGLHFPTHLHAQPGNTSNPAQRRGTSHACIL